MDISLKHDFIDREGLRGDTPPVIFVHYEGNNYPYDGSRESSVQMLHFINKLINPVVNLTTDD